LNTAGDKNEPYLRIENLTKKFGHFTALHDVSLTITEGEFVCFLGPSGCGKTTLLRAIAGLDIQTNGRIWQAGREISDLPASERDFGIVFQSYALFPNLKVRKNIAYGLENKKVARAAVKKRVDELLELVGLTEHSDKYPAQLSGGQQQRVALARALATSPGLLLLDEPLSALDAKVRTYLRHEIKSLQRRLNVTTIMVTHDQEEALTMADRIILLNDGVVEQVDSPTGMYRNPATLFVADFIGTMNQFSCLTTGPDRAKIGGHTVTTRPHSLGEGEEAVLTIRPEDIVPHEKGSRSPDASDNTEDLGNTLAVTIREMEFLGSFWRAELGGDSLGGNTLLTDFSINAVRRMKLESSMSISVELPADRITIYPKNQRQE